MVRVGGLLALFSLLATFAITHGTMDVFGPEVRGRTFVSMWDHLKAGRFDVDADAVDREGIVRDGRTYAYWGPFPALLRGVIEVFVPRGDRDWSRLSCLAAAILASSTLLVLLHSAVEHAAATKADRRQLGLLLSIGWLFGSPLWILMSSAFLYHEAILWAFAWSMLFVAGYLQVRHHGWTVWRGLLLGTSAGFALLSRVPSGVGVGLALGGSAAVGFWKGGSEGPGLPTCRGSRTAIASAIGIYAVLVGFTLLVNYGRWGNPFEFSPFEGSIEHLADPARGARFAEFGPLNLRRVPRALEYYFVPEPENFTRHFPFVTMSGWDPRKNGRGDRFSYMEPYNVPLPASAPFVVAMIVLGIAGVLCGWPAERFLLGCFAVQAVLLWSFMATAMRYQVDLIPFYFLLGLAGMPAFLGGSSRATDLKSALLAVLVVASVYCATITMLFYKSFLFAIPLETRERIFTWIHPR